MYRQPPHQGTDPDPCNTEYTVAILRASILSTPPLLPAYLLLPFTFQSPNLTLVSFRRPLSPGLVGDHAFLPGKRVSESTNRKTAPRVVCSLTVIPPDDALHHLPPISFNRPRDPSGFKVFLQLRSSLFLVLRSCVLCPPKGGVVRQGKEFLNPPSLFSRTPLSASPFLPYLIMR